MINARSSGLDVSISNPPSASSGTSCNSVVKEMVLASESLASER
jgi:hypothetical protein